MCPNYEGMWTCKIVIGNTMFGCPVFSGRLVRVGWVKVWERELQEPAEHLGQEGS